MKFQKWMIYGVVLVITLLLVTTVLAQSLYNISWWIIDSGGGTSQAGNYSLSGGIGQPAVGPTLYGGIYRIDGGFWSNGGNLTTQINIPLILKTH